VSFEEIKTPHRGVFFQADFLTRSSTLHKRGFICDDHCMRSDRRMTSAVRWASVALFAIVTPIACAPAPDEQGTAALITLSSSSLADGTIPKKYTCDGAGSSPALAWTAPPPGTQSLALIMTDLDSPVGHLRRHLFEHWVMYGLPADAHELPEGVPAQPQLPNGARQAKNGINNIGYAGPCPHGTAPHRYAFTLYALDSKLDFPDAPNGQEVLKAIHGHVIGRGQLVATFHR
jgi:Raf kinase inhibitor-like YbhB/YbcL family protein